jgi:SAM-dependent methyltransferase
MKATSPLTRFRYFADREDYLRWHTERDEHGVRRAYENAFLGAHEYGLRRQHFCHVHDAYADIDIGPTSEAADPVNWREFGACAVCGGITRIRLAAEWIARAAINAATPKIYLTEQLTPLYKSLRKRYPELIGSEFVPEKSERESATLRLASYLGDPTATIRHEDVCSLTMPSESLDLIGSFDVLEHVPDCEQALTEFFRVLAPGGQLLLTVPFRNGCDATLTRARWTDGQLEHLLPPEYHGNPTLPAEGVLCYYHFGWDLLTRLREIGFRAAAVLDAWGGDTAIFGDQIAIVAAK